MAEKLTLPIKQAKIVPPTKPIKTEIERKNPLARACKPKIKRIVTAA